MTATDNGGIAAKDGQEGKAAQTSQLASWLRSDAPVESLLTAATSRGVVVACAQQEVLQAVLHLKWETLLLLAIRRERFAPGSQRLDR